MKMLATRLALAMAVAALFVGCSGASGISGGVSNEAPALKGPVEGPTKEMEALLKAKPKTHSAVKAL